MSLIAKYSICEDDCNSLILRDFTGAYDATLNPGGWWVSTGTNPSVANVLIASLAIKFPDGHIITVNVLDLVLPFPSTNNALEKTLNYAALGIALGSQLPNGIYRTTLSVSGTNTHTGGANAAFATTASRDIFITCKAWCCVAKLFVKAAQEQALGKKCWSDTMRLAKSLSNKLMGAEASFDCGDYNSATFVLGEVEAACVSNGCSSC